MPIYVRTENTLTHPNNYDDVNNNNNNNKIKSNNSNAQCHCKHLF